MSLRHCDLYIIETLDSDDVPLKCIYFFNKQLICLNSNSRFLLFSDMHKISVCFFYLPWELGSTLCFRVPRAIRSLGRVYTQNIVFPFLSFLLPWFFYFIFFILNLTIISLRWFSNPLSLHVFQINVTYLVWCQLGPALR